MWEHDERDGEEQGRESPEGSAGSGDGEAAGDSRSEESGSGEGVSSEDDRRSKGETRKDVWEKGLSEFQEVVGDIIGSIRSIPAAGARPRHDLIQVPGEGYWAFLDLPGVSKADLEVTTVDDDLIVSGELRRPELPEGSEVLESGRCYGRFRREIRMPVDVDHGAIRAKLEGGVLKLVLPRRREAERVRVEIEE